MIESGFLHACMNPCLKAKNKEELKLFETRAAALIKTYMVEKFGYDINALHPATGPKTGVEETLYETNRKKAATSKNVLHKRIFFLDEEDVRDADGNFANTYQWPAPWGNLKKPTDDGLQREDFDVSYYMTNHNAMSPVRRHKKMKVDKNIRFEWSMNSAKQQHESRRKNWHGSTENVSRSSYKTSPQCRASPYQVLNVLDLDKSMSAARQGMLKKSNQLQPVPTWNNGPSNQSLRHCSFGLGTNNLDLLNRSVAEAMGAGSAEESVGNMMDVSFQATNNSHEGTLSSPNSGAASPSLVMLLGRLKDTPNGTTPPGDNAGNAGNALPNEAATFDSPSASSYLKSLKVSPVNQSDVDSSFWNPHQLASNNFGKSEDQEQATSSLSFKSYKSQRHVWKPSRSQDDMDLALLQTSFLTSGFVQSEHTGMAQVRNKIVSHRQDMIEVVNRAFIHGCSDYCLIGLKEKWKCRLGYGSITKKDRKKKRNRYVQCSGKPCHQNPGMYSSGGKTKYEGVRTMPAMVPCAASAAGSWRANIDFQLCVAGSEDLQKLTGDNHYHVGGTGSTDVLTPANNVNGWIEAQQVDPSTDNAADKAERLRLAKLYCSRDYMDLSYLSLKIQEYICGYACVRELY